MASGQLCNAIVRPLFGKGRAVSDSNTVQIELFITNAQGMRECRLYELPVGCDRIVVDADFLHGEVWGFTGTDERQITAVLRDVLNGLLLG